MKTDCTISFRHYETAVWEGDVTVTIPSGDPSPSKSLLRDSVRKFLGMDPIDASVEIREIQRWTGDLGTRIEFRLVVTKHVSQNASVIDLPLHRQMPAPDPQDFVDEKDFDQAERNWLENGTYAP
jgi:hypothetical protein